MISLFVTATVFLIVTVFFTYIFKYLKPHLLVLSIGVALLALSGCSAPQHNLDLVRLDGLKDRAYAGNPQDQYQLGIYYSTKADDLLGWNKARGHRWFLKAAQSDDADSQYMVAMNKMLGQGTDQDEAEAVSWLIRAAEQGHSRSQYQLARAYLNGAGAVKDPSWGRYWLEQSAWAGHAQAQFLLAALFSKGLGGENNIVEASAWLRRSEAQGLNEAKIALQRLEPKLSAAETLRSHSLFRRVEKVEEDGLYKTPKVRYVQTVLNSKGISSGAEDGQYGPITRKAVERYLVKEKQPRDTSIDMLIKYLRGS